MEWGGAEPLPRASNLRRERGGGPSEDSVLCLSVCLSVRTAKTQKMEISRNFAHFAQMEEFCSLGWNFTQIVTFCQIPGELSQSFSLPISLTQRVRAAEVSSGGKPGWTDPGGGVFKGSTTARSSCYSDSEGRKSLGSDLQLWF